MIETDGSSSEMETKQIEMQMEKLDPVWSRNNATNEKKNNNTHSHTGNEQIESHFKYLLLRL